MKFGRPPKDATPRTGLHVITFRADDATYAALERLERKHPAVRGRRSQVLREIINAADKKDGP